MVSVEKMPTNIFRKLDIAVERNVVNAHSREVTPRTAEVTSLAVAATTSATRPNSATPMLNGFMGSSSGVSAPASAAAGESTSPSYHRIKVRQNVQGRGVPKRNP